MNPFLLLDTDPTSLRRVTLKPPLGDAAREMFLAEATKFERDIEDLIPFDPGYQLQDGECFVIEDFDVPTEILTACRQPISVDRLHAAELPGLPIRSVVGYDFANGAKRIFFQNFNTRRVLIPGSKFAVWETADTSSFRELSKPVLLLEDKLAMVWDDGTLKFRSFALAHRIFDLTSYFLEATDEQIGTFSAHEKMACSDRPKLVAICSSWHRKKISLIMRGGRLDSRSMNGIKKAASAVGYDLPMAGNKIDLPTEKKALKALLQFLDEDLYVGPISQIRFISSGKRPAS